MPVPVIGGDETAVVLKGLKQRRAKAVRLSIVIPAYNEEARLPETLRKTVNWCGELGDG